MLEEDALEKEAAFSRSPPATEGVDMEAWRGEWGVKLA